MSFRIQFRSSSIHGQGGFALQTISQGEKILEYLGEKITKAESLIRCEAGNPYIFTIDDESDLDGNFDWNPARLLNHSCAPNCEAEQDEEDHIWIVAKRDIKAGEELTFNYGYELESYREHPCQCGASECVGYMVSEEYFEHMRQQTGNQGALAAGNEKC